MFLLLTDRTGATVLVNVAASSAVQPVPNRAPRYVRETVEEIATALVVHEPDPDGS